MGEASAPLAVSELGGVVMCCQQGLSAQPELSWCQRTHRRKEV